MNKEDKKNVLIYALYHENEFYYDFSDLTSIDCDKEEQMKLYCKENGYEVEEIVRKYESDYMFYKLNCVMEIIDKYKTMNYTTDVMVKLDKIIIYDIYELCYNIDEFNTLFNLITDEHIEIETIKQGKISKKTFDRCEVEKYEKR